MRIADLQAIPVAFPDPPLRNSWGVHAPLAFRTIVKVRTDDGLVGVGETYGARAGSTLFPQDDQDSGPFGAAKRAIVGMSPYHLNRIRYLVPNPHVYQAIEIACLDIIGQATGQPLCDLLGGAVRDRVPFSAYLFYKFAGDDPWGEVNTPEAMVKEAEYFVERFGFRTLKLKGGVLPPTEEIETIRLLRERFGPQMELRIDPNAIWSVETSIRVARQLEPYDLEYLEDPTWGIEGMAEVARHTAIPLATNMCVTRFDDIPLAVRAGAVRVILGDHHAWGGLIAFQQLGRICDTFALGLSMHSNSHLGVSMAAMIHAAAVTPRLITACDTHYNWLQDDLIVGEMFHFEDGTLPVPTAPGLGVRVDEEKLALFHERFLKSAEKARDDTAAMRRRDPKYLPIRPRW